MINRQSTDYHKQNKTEIKTMKKYIDATKGKYMKMDVSSNTAS